MIGASLYSILYFLFDYLGARLIQYMLFVMGFILATGISYVDIGNLLKGRFSNIGQNFKDRMKEWLQDRKRKSAAVSYCRCQCNEGEEASLCAC